MAPTNNTDTAATPVPRTINAWQEWREGWGVVAAAAVGIAVAGMYFHLIGTMIKPFQEAFGWARGEIAFGLTLITGIHVVGNLVAGQLVDRFGARRVALCGTWAYGIGCASLGLAGPALWSWYALCAVFALCSLGVGAVTWTTGIVRRFHVQRGLALAVSLAGTGLVVAITPSLVVWLLERVGLRNAFFVLGGGGALLTWVIAWPLFRDRAGPEPVSQARAPVARTQAQATELPGLEVREALHSRRFWQLALALLLISVCVGTFVVHLQPLLLDSGMTAASAAKVAFFVGPSVVAGRLITGALFDHLEARRVACLAFSVPALACMLLLQLDGSPALAAVAGVLVGLGIGAEVDVVGYLTSRYFGLRRYGVLFAILVGLYTFGIGAGSALAGSVFDLMKSYQPVLIGLTGFAAVAMLLVATLGPAPSHAGKPARGAH